MPPPRSPTILNKIRAREYIKKIINTAKNFQKIIVHAGNGPPPHHFSNGPSLIDFQYIFENFEIEFVYMETK